MRKVKSILVTQEAPADANSPYLKLSEKFNVKIDFRPFIQVEPVPVKEFRKQKIDILNHTAIIFTSRNAVDHFFHICQELKVEYIMTTLRTSAGCDLSVLKSNFGYDVMALHARYLEHLRDQKLIILNNGHLTLTRTGRLLADKISSDLFLVA